MDPKSEKAMIRLPAASSVIAQAKAVKEEAKAQPEAEETDEFDLLFCLEAEKFRFEPYCAPMQGQIGH